MLLLLLLFNLQGLITISPKAIKALLQHKKFPGLPPTVLSYKH